MTLEGGGSLPKLISLRQASQEVGEKTRTAAGHGKRFDVSTTPANMPSTRRPFEELLTALRKGADMMKHGRQGKPKMHYFRVADNDTQLTWRSAKGSQRGVSLRSVTQIVIGQTTESFKRYPNASYNRLSFSLIYDSKEGSGRTLDLTANDEQALELWFCGLQALVDILHPCVEKVPNSPGANMLSQLSSAGAVGMPLSGPDPSAALKGSIASGAKQLRPSDGSNNIPLQGIGGGTAQGRVTGAMGLPVPEHQPGDCCRWGMSRPSQPTFGNPRPRIQSHTPQVIQDIAHLDVQEVAVGLSHAALLTKGGEMYTWGDGSGGKLGNGNLQDLDSPQRLHTLWSQPVKHIAVSDTSTCALTGDGQLLTWGEAATSSLGYAGVQRQYIPRLVGGALTERVIVQVSCGAFHTAAVSSDGALFTWGEGLCGKLGHGDHDTCTHPRQVEGLKDKQVNHVACGAWHTAAVAAPRPQGPDLVDKLPFIERLAVQHKLAAMYELTEEDEGQLYTWGCDFSCGRPGLAVAGKQGHSLDHHRGCLGLGTTLGQLTPARVTEGLGSRAVVSVAAGLCFTVAVTSDGTVWQTGETGAGGKGASWEGCLVPTQVGGPLSSHFAESVSAGRYHAAALAGPMNAATGKAYEGLESTVVYMWGRGLEGQLGNGSYASSSTPQLVEDLQDRRISQVACGGFQTMAVCAHDPKADDTEERRKGYKAKMKQWFSGSRLALDTVKDGHNSGPPSASSGVQTRASSQRESAAGLPRPGTAGHDPKDILLKTLSGASSSATEARPYARARRKRGLAGSVPGLPPSGVNTPRVSVPGTGPDRAMSSDAHVSPRTLEADSWKAGSGPGSKHSSLSSHEASTAQNSLRNEGTAQASEKEHIKSLEARIEQLQEILRQQTTSSSFSRTARMPDIRPSVIDVGAVTDPRATLKLPLSGTLSGNLHPTTRRINSSATGHSPNRMSRTSLLPNARSSMLVQNLEEMTSAAAEGWDPANEAEDLARLRAALSTQLEQVEQRMASLDAGTSAAQLDSPGRPNSARFEEQPKKVATANRKAWHRRSKSGSNVSSIWSLPRSPFADAQSQPFASPGSTQRPLAKPTSDEVAPGVYVTLQAEGGGHNRLTKIRFSRHMFSHESANQWWTDNKHWLAQKYSLKSAENSSSGTLQPVSHEPSGWKQDLRSMLQCGRPSSELVRSMSEDSLDEPRNDRHEALRRGESCAADTLTADRNSRPLHQTGSRLANQGMLNHKNSHLQRAPAGSQETSEFAPTLTASNDRLGRGGTTWLNPQTLPPMQPQKGVSSDLDALVEKDSSAEVFWSPREHSSPSRDTEVGDIGREEQGGLPQHEQSNPSWTPTSSSTNSRETAPPQSTPLPSPGRRPRNYGGTGIIRAGSLLSG